MTRLLTFLLNIKQLN